MPLNSRGFRGAPCHPQSVNRFGPSTSRERNEADFNWPQQKRFNGRPDHSFGRFEQNNVGRTSNGWNNTFASRPPPPPPHTPPFLSAPPPPSASYSVPPPPSPSPVMWDRNLFLPSPALPLSPGMFARPPPPIPSPSRGPEQRPSLWMSQSAPSFNPWSVPPPCVPSSPVPVNLNAPTLMRNNLGCPERQGPRVSSTDPTYINFPPPTGNFQPLPPGVPPY